MGVAAAGLLPSLVIRTMYGGTKCLGLLVLQLYCGEDNGYDHCIDDRDLIDFIP